MESNPYTIQELINFIHKETAETMIVTPRMLENRGIFYGSCTLKIKSGSISYQEVEVYLFPLQDGIYLYRKNGGINFLNMTQLEKMTPEHLDAVVERKESIVKEQKTLEMVLNHPSQRLRKLYSKKTN